MFFEHDNLYKKQNLYPLFPFLSLSRVTFRTKYGRNKLTAPWLLSPMSPGLRHFPPTNCTVEADRYTSNVIAVATGTQPLEAARVLTYRHTQRRRSQVATQNSSCSKRPYKFSLHFSFMSICQYTTGSMLKTELFPRIHLFLPVVSPPRTVEAVNGSITKVENIKDRENTSLFLTPDS